MFKLEEFYNFGANLVMNTYKISSKSVSNRKIKNKTWRYSMPLFVLCLGDLLFNKPEYLLYLKNAKIG